MAIIQNMLNQRLIITVRGGRMIEILAHGSAAVSDGEIGSSHIETLAGRGAIVIAREPGPATKKLKEPQRERKLKTGSKAKTTDTHKDRKPPSAKAIKRRKEA